MRIGEIARSAGVRPSAIRYYESLGLLQPPARISGRRDYAADAVDRLALIAAAQQAGFSLREMRGLLAVLSGPSMSQRWQATARSKLRALDDKIARLALARQRLADAIDCACAGDVKSCKLVMPPQKAPSRSGRRGINRAAARRGRGGTGDATR